MQAFEASPALDPTAAGMSKSLPAQRSPYAPSVVDLRSIARPCNTPAPAKPSVCLENTNAKIARLVAKPTPSKAPAPPKPVRRTLDMEFQSAGSVNDGTSLPMDSPPGPPLKCYDANSAIESFNAPQGAMVVKHMLPRAKSYLITSLGSNL